MQVSYAKGRTASGVAAPSAPNRVSDPPAARRQLAAATAVAALALLLGSGCASIIGGTRDEVQRHPQTHLLHVSSQPPGASVLLGDQWLGVTPLQIPLRYDRVRTQTYNDLPLFGFLMDAAWIPFTPFIGIPFIIYDGMEDGDLVRDRERVEDRSYALRVTKDGYQEVLRRVRAPKDEAVQVQLRPLVDRGGAPAAAASPPPTATAVGFLRVTSDPPGLPVTVEGVEETVRIRVESKTPFEAPLPAGRYRVRVGAGDLQTDRTRVTVAAGERTHLALVPRPASAR